MRQVCALPLPVVAIGGITLDTVADVARAGARAAAIIRAVNAAADVTAAARLVMSAFPSGHCRAGVCEFADCHGRFPQRSAHSLSGSNRRISSSPSRE